MMRIPALAATLLCLAGCFVFDNPWDSASPPSTPTVTFQIVVNSIAYTGTYVWSSTDNTYAELNGIYHLYVDPEGYWVMSYLPGWNHYYGGTYGTYPAYGALPPTDGTYWSPPGEIQYIDDSAGGICRTNGAPDSTVGVGNTLQVTFKASDPGNLATYQWERSFSPSWPSSVPVGPESTYTPTSADKYAWLRVIITPSDRTGLVAGPPVKSPPVYIFN